MSTPPDRIVPSEHAEHLTIGRMGTPLCCPGAEWFVPASIYRETRVVAWYCDACGQGESPPSDTPPPSAP